MTAGGYHEESDPSWSRVPRRDASVLPRCPRLAQQSAAGAADRQARGGRPSVAAVRGRHPSPAARCPGVRRGLPRRVAGSRARGPVARQGYPSLLAGSPLPRGACPGGAIKLSYTASR